MRSCWRVCVCMCVRVCVCVCACVCVCVTLARKHDISKTVHVILVIYGTVIAHDLKMCPIVFGIRRGHQRSDMDKKRNLIKEQ